jgi:hypothetical protein
MKMAFNNDKHEIKGRLEKIGAKVEVNEAEKQLIVDDKYVINYNSGYYRRIEDKKSMGRGTTDFVDMIARENKLK